MALQTELSQKNPKGPTRPAAAVIATLVMGAVTVAGCGAKPTPDRVLTECTPTTEHAYPSPGYSDSRYDTFFAVRLDANADELFALISAPRKMNEWISIIEESWIERVTSERRFLGGAPDLTRSWRVGQQIFTEDVRYPAKEGHTLLYALNLARSKTDLSLTAQTGVLIVDSCLEGGSMLRWWQSFDASSGVARPTPTSSVPHLTIPEILNDLISRFGGHRI